MANVTDSKSKWSVSSFTTTVKQGLCFSCTVPLKIVSAEKNASTTATKWYLLSGNTYSWTPLASGDYSGNTATINYTVNAGTYTICNDNAGSNYTNRYSTVSYPEQDINVKWESAWDNNTIQWLDIESITTDADVSKIKTINWLAKASVKTVNGLAIANVKTFNWLA